MSQKSGSKSQDVKIVYTSCLCNCGSNGHCVIKAHIKDGKVVAVEPDDRYNTGVGREDEVLSEEDLIKTRLQRRPCTRGLVFHKYLHHPDRILYPLKRDPTAQRGEGKFIRVSWDEALTTISDKMNGIRDKYGPYSIIIPYSPNGAASRLMSLWGAGVTGWGAGSFDAARLMSHVVAGESGRPQIKYASGSAADMLANSKLIVIWGFDPAMGSSGPGYQFAWFLRLAREKGTKVIIFDPRYTPSAEVLADQWIPIKPGTDSAMFMAIAYVLFKKGTWNKEFVKKFVEPLGFKKWKNYVLGLEDGTAKTPEWAETICAVPSVTIRELAELIDTTRPAWLWSHWGVARKSRGEDSVRAFAALQAMLGYWGNPGAGPALHLGPNRAIPMRAPQGPPGEYKVPSLYRGHYWAQAVLLLYKVRSGNLNEKEYMRMVGWKADPSLLKDFNPKMIFWGGQHAHASDHLITACDTPNFQTQAMKRMEFIVAMHSLITPTMKYADIILPPRDPMWEEHNIVRGSYGGFECINYCRAMIKPSGEAKPYMLAYCELAEKLGINPKRFFKYYTTDENWDKDWEIYQRDCYKRIEDHYNEQDIVIPSWEDFSNGKFINCDELDEKPFTGFEEQIMKDKPFKTESGKIEFYSGYIANEANRGRGEHFDHSDRSYSLLPGDWGSLRPYIVYENAVRGMDDPMVEKYPLMLLSPHARYRVHYLFWEHPWLRGQVYNHRVWMSATDAQARGVRDGDLIKVYNDRGTVVMPAYVTSRIMPGLIVIRHGGKYEPDESGIDWGASPSTLLGGDFESPITPAKTTNLVQVEKYIK